MYVLIQFLLREVISVLFIIKCDKQLVGALTLRDLSSERHLSRVGYSVKAVYSNGKSTRMSLIQQL